MAREGRHNRKQSGICYGGGLVFVLVLMGFTSSPIQLDNQEVIEHEYKQFLQLPYLNLNNCLTFRHIQHPKLKEKKQVFQNRDFWSLKLVQTTRFDQGFSTQCYSYFPDAMKIFFGPVKGIFFSVSEIQIFLDDIKHYILFSVNFVTIFPPEQVLLLLIEN